MRSLNWSAVAIHNGIQQPSPLRPTLGWRLTSSNDKKPIVWKIRYFVNIMISCQSTWIFIIDIVAKCSEIYIKSPQSHKILVVQVWLLAFSSYRIHEMLNVVMFATWLKLAWFVFHFSYRALHSIICVSVTHTTLYSRMTYSEIKNVFWIRP